MCIYVYYICSLHFSLPRGRLAMESPTLPLTTGVYQQIPLASIPTDEASQARIKIRPGVVRAYAQAMIQQRSEGGLRFPAVVLFTDGQHYWLGDGFHRILAARAAGLADFPADVRPGTQRRWEQGEQGDTVYNYYPTSSLWE